MKRILIIAGITAGCVLIAAGFLFFRSTAEGPVLSAAPAPVIDVAGLKAKARQGDPQAQTQLGKAFAQGEGVARDYKQAAHWYGQAASNGNVEAEAMLGELCQAGQGVERNLAKAVQLFAHAAEAGSVAAQYDLAYLYEQGRGVPKDEKLAAKWYRLASEAGDPAAQYDYGQRCVLGVGVAKDPVEGLKWLLVAQSRKQSGAREKVASVESTLDRAQIEEARRRAAAFVPRSPL
jgi:TPR repeat protein